MQVVDDVAGSRVDILTLTTRDWRTIHDGHMPMRCRGCGALAYPREMPYPEVLPSGETRTRLVPMFCHYPGEAEKCRALGYDSESPAHVVLKHAVAKAAERAGHRAELEVIHDDGCRSDVVITNTRRRRRDGFEVQLSPQAVDLAVTRQERYVSHLDGATWLHPKARQWARRVPALRLDEDTLSIVVGGIVVPPDEITAEPMPVDDAVTKVLGEDIRYVYAETLGEGFGYFLARPEAKMQPRPDRKRQSAQYRGEGTRYCEREPAAGSEQAHSQVAAGHCAHCTFPVYGRGDAPDAHPCCARWIGELGYDRCFSCRPCAPARVPASPPPCPSDGESGTTAGSGAQNGAEGAGVVTLTATDLFAGAGGSSLGAEGVPGVQLVMAANHWGVAVDVHQHHFPHAGHDLADISCADPRRYPLTDLLIASPECFTAGHLVLTERGQVPIEEVRVGDVVLTHLGRWRPVVRVQQRAADTVIVKGQGHTGIDRARAIELLQVPERATDGGT